MRSRIIVGVFLLFGVLAASTVATSGDGVGPQKRWAIVNFVNPVEIGTSVLLGSYLIVHDDAKMARGEPCTSICRFDPKKGPQEEVVSFHCQPVQRPVADKTILTIVSSRTPGVRRLTEYQFAGDTEGHGIPTLR
jgi:hypothetical protein